MNQSQIYANNASGNSSPRNSIIKGSWNKCSGCSCICYNCTNDLGHKIGTKCSICCTFYTS